MLLEDFLRVHRSDDVRQLALQAGKYPDIDMPYALDQIRGWQTAKKKLPSWSLTDGIIYPPHLSMEQCSSEVTAMYKQKLIERLVKETGSFVDLTGGLGVDFSFMCRSFKQSVYVERQHLLCDNAMHNFYSLKLGNAKVICGDGVEYLHHIEHVDAIYLDPARRDENGAKTYAIEDCTPDVVRLRDELLDKASWVIIKLSPMLDWHEACRKLGCVAEVHIVSVDNECKELLLVLSKKAVEYRIYCVNNKDIFSYSENEDICQATYRAEPEYLYEPNASIMKAGCFALLSARYPVKAIGDNSHLYFSDKEIDEFPGRRFKIVSMLSMNKKELRKSLAEISKANITTRNFPMSVAELRKKLKIKEGGDTYIFATTMENGAHSLIMCKKLM